MGAAAFLYPKDSNMPLTGDELDQLRKNLQDKVRKGGVGGIEPVSVPIELIPVPIDNEKYRLTEIRTQLIRELCNLFQIDSSLLNDPENKTYSNKTLALKALYTNVIIPTAYEVAYALQTRTLDYVITIETSNIELLHEVRVAQADYVIKLLQAGLLTPATKSGAPGISPAHRWRPRVDWFGMCITSHPATDKACTMARWTSLSLRGKYGLLAFCRNRMLKVSHLARCGANKKAPSERGRGRVLVKTFVP
jgi:hypothetical protein